MLNSEKYEKELTLQTQKRRATVEFISVISDLWYDKSIEMVLFRNPLIDQNVSHILNLIDYGTEFVGKSISIFDALLLAKAIKTIDLSHSKIDLGKMAFLYSGKSEKIEDAIIFVKEELIEAESINEIEPKDVVLYGFGRIGRLLARELMTQLGEGKQMRLRAIVVRGAINEQVLVKRASLLSIDSVHGEFSGGVKIDAANNSLIINGTSVQFISANNPEDIDYTKYGINNALIIDNTGAFRDKEQLSRHLKAKGAAKVLLTAPGAGVPNIVYGVNHKDHNPDNVDIFSAASCTTNAITPILKVIEDEFGVENGHLETIHAYTNDQNLVDNMHKKERRGRAAALNMVITEPGAGKAVAKALPALAGKLTSNAIRVPVPNGSLAILSLRINKKTTKSQLNDIMRKHSLEGGLVEQIRYSLNPELVSSDIIGTNCPSIFDSNATIVTEEGNSILLDIWYDNEYGYSHQVIRLARYISKVKRNIYY